MEAATFYIDSISRLAGLFLIWLIFHKIDRVLLGLDEIRREANTMAISTQEQLDLLVQAITEENSEIDGAIVLIDQIPSLIASAGTDPVKIAELINLVQSKSAALKAALTANTPSATAPAAPTPAPAPAPGDAPTGSAPASGDTGSGAPAGDSGAADGSPGDTGGTPPTP
jgi:hypothetical protein